MSAYAVALVSAGLQRRALLASFPAKSRTVRPRRSGRVARACSTDRPNRPGTATLNECRRSRGFAITEGVRQLRGEAAAQAGDPQVSVILGNGGMFATAGVLVLGRQRA